MRSFALRQIIGDSNALFVALYVLIFLTLVVWAVDLIVGIQNRRSKRLMGVGFTAEKAMPNGGTVLIEERVPAVTAEENEDEDEEEAVIVTEGNEKTFRIRYAKSFTAKLIQSDDETKLFYGELKNEVLSYAKTSSRVSWCFDSVSYGRCSILKFGFRGKTLCVYYALDIKDLKGMKYKAELCEYKKYAFVPCMYRIINAQRCQLAKDLIAMVAESYGLVKGARRDVEYLFPYEDNDALIEKGEIKEVKKQVFSSEKA